MSDPLDQLCINTVRFLSVDAVEKANSGHPGMPLGAAAMAYVLWTRLLMHNSRNPDWFDHDRFVLSAAHGSMLLCSAPERVAMQRVRQLVGANGYAYHAQVPATRHAATARVIPHRGSVAVPLEEAHIL